MIALCYDTETTGIPDWKTPSDDPKQPHLVQVGAALVDVTDDCRIISSLNLLVKPDGWIIGPEAVEIHGITTDHALRYGIPEDVAADALYAMAGAADFRIGFCEQFDARLIRIALKRMGADEEADAFKAQPAYCAMRGTQRAIGGKNMKLSEAHATIVGFPMTDAHSAWGDMLATLALYRALCARGEGFAPVAATSVGFG